MNGHDDLLREGEPVEWTCPRCLQKFLTLITQEDLDDGCADGMTLCFTCLKELGWEARHHAEN